jgi:UDP-N-acetylmuramoyl-L-alanyl-D-glutamate--2,6-diaminopimelate ligase
MQMREVLLGTLLDRLAGNWAVAQHGDAPRGSSITAIAEDSRRVSAGTIFVAHHGRGSDGHRYVEAALEAGAVAVAGELPIEELPMPMPPQVPYWQVEDGRMAFALLSAAFFDFPSRKMVIVGVTGTDGKTTTSTLVHSVLMAAGRRAGLITTISALIGDEALNTGFHVTTPEAFDLQGYLAQMAEIGCEVAVVESTSHALDQRRVAYVDYDVAAVTNVTHEHLDWHGSWENYMAAKARLFEAVGQSARKPGVPKAMVLNRDDRSYPILAPLPADLTLTYSLDPNAGAHLVADDVVVDGDGTHFSMRTPVGSEAVHLRLLGRYNAANALAAASVGVALGVPLDAIVRGLEQVARVKGRMERVYNGDFSVVVDFAHTPNALRETIALSRSLVHSGGRVIVVFGSAGLRDVAKRRMMGEVAGGADVSIVTAEDPRTEDVNNIIAEIVEGLESRGGREGHDFEREPDRARAIARAIELARSGDVVVTCGKAHEQSMCYGTTETPWDEFAAVRAGLEARGVLAG